MSNETRNNFEKIKVAQQLLEKLFSNNADWAETASNIYLSSEMVANSDVELFKVPKKPGSTDNKWPYQAYAPVAGGITYKVLIDRIFGKVYNNETEKYELGDIYDDTELKKVITDTAIAVYSQYYNTNLSDEYADQMYEITLNTLQDSFKLYALICYAWKCQNRKKVTINTRNKEIKFGSLFAFNHDNVSSYTVPFSNINENAYNNDNNIPHSYNASNAIWAQEVVPCLEYVYLPNKVAQFWRDIFGSVYLLPLDKTHYTSVFLDFIPYIQGNTDWENETYQEAVNTTTDIDPFLSEINNLKAAILHRISAYPWLKSMLIALGCDYKPSVISVDGFNLKFETKDDFTRNLAARKPNVIYDKDNYMYNAMQTCCVTNVPMIQIEEEETRLAEYSYLPYFTLFDKDYTPRVSLSNSMSIDVPLESIYTAISFGNLLKGNTIGQTLNLIVSNLYLDNTTWKNSTLFCSSAAVRPTYCIQGAIQQTTEIQLWDMLLKYFNDLPLLSTVLFGTISQTASSPFNTSVSQVSYSEFMIYNIYDGLGVFENADIERYMNARFFMLAMAKIKTNRENESKKGNNYDKKNNQKPDNKTSNKEAPKDPKEDKK